MPESNYIQTNVHPTNGPEKQTTPFLPTSGVTTSYSNVQVGQPSSTQVPGAYNPSPAERAVLSDVLLRQTTPAPTQASMQANLARTGDPLTSAQRAIGYSVTYNANVATGINVSANAGVNGNLSPPSSALGMGYSIVNAKDIMGTPTTAGTFVPETQIGFGAGHLWNPFVGNNTMNMKSTPVSLDNYLSPFLNQAQPSTLASISPSQVNTRPILIPAVFDLQQSVIHGINSFKLFGTSLGDVRADILYNTGIGAFAAAMIETKRGAGSAGASTIDIPAQLFMHPVSTAIGLGKSLVTSVAITAAGLEFLKTGSDIATQSFFAQSNIAGTFGALDFPSLIAQTGGNIVGGQLMAAGARGAGFVKYQISDTLENYYTGKEAIQFSSPYLEQIPNADIFTTIKTGEIMREVTQTELMQRPSLYSGIRGELIANPYLLVSANIRGISSDVIMKNPEEFYGFSKSLVGVRGSFVDITEFSPHLDLSGIQEGGANVNIIKSPVSDVYYVTQEFTGKVQDKLTMVDSQGRMVSSSKWLDRNSLFTGKTLSTEMNLEDMANLRLTSFSTNPMKLNIFQSAALIEENPFTLSIQRGMLASANTLDIAEGNMLNLPTGDIVKVGMGKYFSSRGIGTGGTLEFPIQIAEDQTVFEKLIKPENPFDKELTGIGTGKGSQITTQTELAQISSLPEVSIAKELGKGTATDIVKNIKVPKDLTPTIIESANPSPSVSSFANTMSSFGDLGGFMNQKSSEPPSGKSFGDFSNNKFSTEEETLFIRPEITNKINDQLSGLGQSVSLGLNQKSSSLLGQQNTQDLGIKLAQTPSLVNLTSQNLNIKQSSSQLLQQSTQQLQIQQQEQQQSQLQQQAQATITPTITTPDIGTGFPTPTPPPPTPTFPSFNFNFPNNMFKGKKKKSKTKVLSRKFIYTPTVLGEFSGITIKKAPKNVGVQAVGIRYPVMEVTRRRQHESVIPTQPSKQPMNASIFGKMFSLPFEKKSKKKSRSFGADIDRYLKSIR